MGYSYYILVQGKKNDQWTDIYFYGDSGSYGYCYNHYFYTRSDDTPYLSDTNKHLFTYEKIKEDYLKADEDVTSELEEYHNRCTKALEEYEDVRILYELGP